MKTAISLPDPLYRAADRLARRLHITRSRLYAKAVSRFVKEKELTDVTRRLNEVYRQNAQSSKLSPDIEAMQATSLSREEW